MHEGGKFSVPPGWMNQRPMKLESPVICFFACLLHILDIFPGMKTKQWGL